MPAALLLHYEAFRHPGALPSVMKAQLSAARNIAAAAGSRSVRVLRDCRLLVIWSLQKDRDIENVVSNWARRSTISRMMPELLVSLGKNLGAVAEPDAAAMRFQESRATSAIANRPAGGVQREGVLLNLAGLIYGGLQASTSGRSGGRKRLMKRACALAARCVGLGQPAEALRALEPLRARLRRPPTECASSSMSFRHAWLAAGQAEPSLVRPPSGDPSYPGCQTPQVALGAAPRAAGDQAGARSVIRPCWPRPG